jgi:hypothetical protein
MSDKKGESVGGATDSQKEFVVVVDSFVNSIPNSSTNEQAAFLACMVQNHAVWLTLALEKLHAVDEIPAWLTDELLELGVIVLPKSGGLS